MDYLKNVTSSFDTVMDIARQTHYTLESILKACELQPGDSDEIVELKRKIVQLMQTSLK